MREREEREREEREREREKAANHEGLIVTQIYWHWLGDIPQLIVITLIGVHERDCNSHQPTEDNC